jgi:hypothetical protein
MRPLTLPSDCPKAITYAVEITLLASAKATILSCYLPQFVMDHAQVCKALANLPEVLPHHLLILGGDLQGG